VRTYVTVAGAPGVYFLSLDAANPLAVEVARRWFHLPYHRADMTMRDFGDRTHFRSVRTEEGSPRAELITHYSPTGKSFHADKGSLDYFLVERYCLYATDAEHNIYRAEIHHRPWPLHEATAEVELNEMFLQFGLPLPKLPPVLHFAKRLEVVVWAPTLLFEGAP
jgi:uncharacterized protein